MKYILEITVFICGAVVMILELVGSRVVAPYLGTSIIVWTSLIGIILGSLSLGYWGGGKLADKFPDYKIFSFIIFLSAISVGLTALFKDVILIFLENSFQSIYLKSLISTTILFSPASILLGMVSPYAVRLKIEDLNKSGRLVGNLYALSTIGSIIGTFLAGFFLISFFGNTKILIILAAVLIATSLLAFHKSLLKTKISIFLLLFVSFKLFGIYQESLEKKGIIDTDTPYQRVQISTGWDARANKPIRYLKTDPHGIQSASYLDSDELVFNYLKFYRLVDYFNPKHQHSLMIGGGAYSYPKDYLKKETAKMDVVELDPKLTELARKYFNLKNDTRLTIYHEDGRTFLNKNRKKYDALFIDAFKSYSLPYQLTTKEAVKKIYDSLNDEGVVLTNIISSVEGEKGKFLRAEFRTYMEIFPQVYLFPVQEIDADREQNIILVALKSEVVPAFKSSDGELDSYLQHLYKKELKIEEPVLTDDYAPVDEYIIKLL